MATMFNVSPQELIEKVKEDLKKINEIHPPSWAPFVKTGLHKERAPSQEDWWYIRAASVLRFISVRGPIGVSKLRKKYGGKKDRGVRPSRFRVASGNILRKVLQQLEKAGLAKQAEIGVHKGRVITPAGQKLLDKAATELVKQKPEPEPKKEEAKKEAKPEPESKKEETKKEAKPEPEKEAKQDIKKQDNKEDKKSSKKEEAKEDQPAAGEPPKDNKNG